MEKVKVALFYGGDSGEYEVSVASAGQVKNHLTPDRFEVYPVLVRGGKWIYKDGAGNEYYFDRNRHGIEINSVLINFDCAFIAIHGTPGEDGKLQGYLEMAGVPYTNCDVTVSALTFNKYFCNDLAAAYGAKLADTVLIRLGEKYDAKAITDRVGLPCFVKPNKSGSSVGVSKVYKTEDLKAAVDKSFAEDDETLVQQFIKGREMACGVYSLNGEVKVLEVTEIIPKNDFFDYAAKYGGLSNEITPANITEKERKQCVEMTANLYKKFNCKGVVRFDYFLVDGQWWFLEVNTVPGFSAESIVPQQVKATGVSLDDFYGSLVMDAIAQKAKR